MADRGAALALCHLPSYLGLRGKGSRERAHTQVESLKVGACTTKE